MEINLAEKLKSLRKAKNVSQEKLAQYLNVSYQAVSKWENGGAYPDISLLPEIARYFGITVDELLQAEKLDEKKLYEEYREKTAEIFQNGQNVSDLIPMWEEAYHKMPNNVNVKEGLMSIYFDADKVKHQNRIIELGTEIYNSDTGTYYKGQAIMEIARTYAETGNMEMAERWVDKAYQLMHSSEMINMQILTDGKELLAQFRFANYWYFNSLFYMSARLINCKDLPGGTAYIQAVEKAIVQLYEIVYPDDDMNFESLRIMCIQHRCIAEDEAGLGRDENVIRHHLTRALECARKSCFVTEHDLTHPLLTGWHVDAAPSENKQVVQSLQSELAWECFDPWRNTEWFTALEKELNEIS